MVLGVTRHIFGFCAMAVTGLTMMCFSPVFRLLLLRLPVWQQTN